MFNFSFLEGKLRCSHSLSHFTLSTGPLSFVLVHFPLCCHHALTSSPHSHSHPLTSFPSLSHTHSLSSSLQPSHSYSLPPSLLQESAVVFVEGADHSSLSIAPEDFARYAGVTPTRPTALSLVSRFNHLTVPHSKDNHMASLYIYLFSLFLVLC